MMLATGKVVGRTVGASEIVVADAVVGAALVGLADAQPMVMTAAIGKRSRWQWLSRTGTKILGRDSEAVAPPTRSAGRHYRFGTIFA
jgi:hypothetical protein